MQFSPIKKRGRKNSRLRLCCLLAVRPDQVPGLPSPRKWPLAVVALRWSGLLSLWGCVWLHSPLNSESDQHLWDLVESLHASPWLPKGKSSFTAVGRPQSATPRPVLVTVSLDHTPLTSHPRLLILKKSDLRPRGSGWRGRWEGGSGWGTRVNPWLFHFNVWQNPLQIKKK